MRFLRRNTDATIFFGPVQNGLDQSILDDAANISSVNLHLSKVGADFVTPTIGALVPNVLTGWYKVTMPASNWTNNGRHTLFIDMDDSPGDIPITIEFTVLPEAVYDALILGTDRLETDVREWLGLDTPANFNSLSIDLNGKVSASSVTTVNDKSGYSLSTTGIDAIFSRPRGISFGSYGETLNWLQSAFVSAGVFSTPSLVNSPVVSDKTGYSLSAAGIEAIFDKARTGADAGSYGETINWVHAAFASAGVFSENALANAPSTGGGSTVVTFPPILQLSGPAVINKPSTGTIDYKYDVQAWLATGAPLSLATGGARLLETGNNTVIAELSFALTSADDAPLHWDLVNTVTGARGELRITLGVSSSYTNLVLQVYVVTGGDTIIENIPITVKDAVLTTQTVQLDELRA